MLPLSRALLYIFLSTVSISGSATLGWLYYVHLDHARTQNDRYYITAVVQTGPRPRQLPTGYLAELLDVSVDQPQNLYTYDCKEGVKRLVHSPHITSAKVARLAPNALYVDYTARIPAAYLGDFDNVLIDEEGVPFPAAPYFTPKRLPALVIGIEEVAWGEAIKGRRIRLALALLCLLQQEGVNPSRIDVSRAYHKSAGRAEVVLEFDTGPVATVRWRTEAFMEQLSDLKLLIKHLDSSNRFIVDMRVEQLAFLLKNIK